MNRVESIFGPPGTGKTTRLVEIAGDAIPRIGKVLYLSYTKAAAIEAASRVNSNRIEASTLHSLAYRALNIQRSQVVTREKLQAFSDLVGVPFKGTDLNSMEETQEGDEYMAVIQYANARRIDVHEAYDLLNRPGTVGRFEVFEESYRRWKEEYGLIDFDDMLLLLLQRQFVPSAPVVILDEAQDCSPLHWELFHRIAKQAKEVYLAGDDDQAIYEWNGADPHGMIEFRIGGWSNVTEVLDKSHRIPGIVHAFVHDKLLSQFQRRVPKKFEPRKDEEGGLAWYGDPHVFDFHSLAGKDVKILVRDRFEGLNVQRMLNAEMIPYKVAGGWSPFYNKKINAIRAIVKLNRGDEPTDTETHALLDTVRNLGAHPESVVIGKRWQDLVPLGKNDRAFYEDIDLDAPLTIELSTIHQAKGKEADVVVVDLAVTGSVELNIQKNRDAELRVWYVACTRARKELHLLGGNPLL